jgi:hypothetical protein
MELDLLYECACAHLVANHARQAIARVEASSRRAK